MAKEVARVLVITEKTVYGYVLKELIPSLRCGSAPATSASG
jgi:hypothetical protein